MMGVGIVGQKETLDNVMTRSRQSNWGTQEILLHEISKQLDRLTKIMGVVAENVKTTTTTTTSP